MKVKVISLPYIFQVLYVLCFTRPRLQVSVNRPIGPLVLYSLNNSRHGKMFSREFATKVMHTPTFPGTEKYMITLTQLCKTICIHGKKLSLKKVF